LKIREIDEADSADLERFLSKLGSGAASFRYFASRPLSVINKHLKTILLYNIESEPIGYGHLEWEDDICWLGIAIAEKSKGKGYGKMMMQELFLLAKRNNVELISLSVDRSNQVAASMYEKLGFQLFKETDQVLFYNKEL